jgi:hypothetical protein
VVSASAASLRVTLHGDNHAPNAGKPWHYSVLAVDGSGRAVSGTVATAFALGSQIVGREAPHSQKLTDGLLKDYLTFPARAVGIPLDVQIAVHTRLGSVTLSWSVKVRR